MGQRQKKEHKPRMPCLMSSASLSKPTSSCDSWGCDIICRNTNIFLPFYCFIPKICLISGYEITGNTFANREERVYCEPCMNQYHGPLKNKNGKVIKQIKRIRGRWVPTDYGHLTHLIKNRSCDFCEKKSAKLNIRSSQFTTNCEYNGVRLDHDFYIIACNKCLHKNPEQVFKLCSTVDEYNFYIQTANYTA
jgi:hypothetical protein